MIDTAQAVMHDVSMTSMSANLLPSVVEAVANSFANARPRVFHYEGDSGYDQYEAAYRMWVKTSIAARTALARAYTFDPGLFDRTAGRTRLA